MTVLNIVGIKQTTCECSQKFLAFTYVQKSPFPTHKNSAELAIEQHIIRPAF